MSKSQGKKNWPTRLLYFVHVTEHAYVVKCLYEISKDIIK